MPVVNVTAAPLPVLPQGSPPASSQPKEQLRRACQEFEALFIYKLLEQMRATVPQEGYLHGKQEDIYQTICDQQVALTLARGRGIGLSELLQRQLSGQDRGRKAASPGEVATPTPAPAENGSSGSDIQGLSRWRHSRSIRE